MNIQRRRLMLAGSSSLLATGLRPARAQQSTSVVRILIGLPAGGGTDAIARFIADRLGQHLGRPIMIDNRPGVGGRLAANALAEAAPDGLTYMIAPNATPTFQTLVFGPQLRWDLWRDFAPVAGLVSYPLGMAVAARLGVEDAKGFIAWAKSHPDEATFGTPGLGGQNHFLGLQFSQAAGLALRAAPYRGTPPLIVDLVGGHVPAAVTLLDEMIRHHRSGKVRIIGIFSDERSALMPEIPTFKEQGLPVMSSDGWTAMWTRAGTPAAEISRMQEALRKVLSDPQVRQDLIARLSVESDYLDGEQMAQRQRQELDAWKPIIDASGFKPE